MKSVKSITEGETLALIHNYGIRVSGAGNGLAGTTRADLIEWGERIVELAKTMPAKNGRYLSEDHD